SAMAFGVVATPSIVDPHVVADSPAQLLQPLMESCEARLSFSIIGDRIHEHADPPHPLRLLRSRRERPSGYTAAEKCDEFPPPHGAYPKAKDHELIIAPCIAAKRATHVRDGSFATEAIRSGDWSIFALAQKRTFRNR